MKQEDMLCISPSAYTYIINLTLVMECTDEGYNGVHLDHAFKANGVMDALSSSALS